MRDCNDTITLYNARYDWENDCDIYERTLINGVHWYNEIISAVESSGLKAANKCTLRIPTDADFGGAHYVEAGNYNPCIVGEAIAGKAVISGTSFTLRAGDIIVHGNVSDVHPRPKDLHDNYECITILGITDMSQKKNAPHWKVVGA